MLRGYAMSKPTPPLRRAFVPTSDPDNMQTSSGLPYRVLIIEDDVELARLTAEYLTKRNIEVSIEHRGDEAIARVAREQPHLIVLDVMLPGMDGFDICRALRIQGTDVPIIMLTARDEDIDQVLGLEMGADDYLAKPVQPRVLLAHIKAILRRSANLLGDKAQRFFREGARFNLRARSFGKYFLDGLRLGEKHTLPTSRACRKKQQAH